MGKKPVLIVIAAVALVIGAKVLWMQMHHGVSDEHEAFVDELETRTEQFVKNKENDKVDEPDEALKNSLIERFVDNSFITSEFAGIQDMLTAQKENFSKLQVPQEQKDRLIKIMTDIFDPNTIFDSYLNKLYSQMSADELKELEAVYSNKDVEKTMRAMQHIRSKEGQAEFAKYLTELPNKPLSAERLVLLKQLDETTSMSTQAATLASEVMNLTQDAIYGKQMDKLTPQQKQQMTADREKFSQMMAQKVKENIMFTLAKSHADLNDEQLKEVVALRSKGAAVKEGKIRVDNMSEHIHSEKAKGSYEQIMSSSLTK